MTHTHTHHIFNWDSFCIFMLTFLCLCD